VSVKVQYLRLRKGVFQFHLRVPQNLLDHYGKDCIRKSLGTSDIKEATRKAEEDPPGIRQSSACCLKENRSHRRMSLRLAGCLLNSMTRTLSISLITLSTLPERSTQPVTRILIRMPTLPNTPNQNSFRHGSYSPIPHVYFRDKLWRTLKTEESERRVPVVGIALDALRLAVKLPVQG
jgi:hypothetical protein